MCLIGEKGSLLTYKTIHTFAEEAIEWMIAFAISSHLHLSNSFTTSPTSQVFAVEIYFIQNYYH